LRFSAADSQLLVDHYLEALKIRRQAHEMLAIWGGKMPHAAAFEAGGVTTVPKADMITRIQRLSQPVISIHRQRIHARRDLLAETYPEYYTIGRGYGNSVWLWRL